MTARQQRSQETHGRLLEAAVACFAQKGYDGASVADICACAGVSKGAFYHHFESKQALFLELLESWLAGLDAQLASVRLGAATIPEGIQRMARLIRPVFAMADGQVPMFLEFLNQAQRDPAVWQITVQPYRRYRAFFARLIAEGVAEGSLRVVDPDTAAQVLVSLAVGLFLQGLLDPEGADWGQVAEDGVMLLLAGLAGREPGQTP